MENPIPWWVTQILLAVTALFFIFFGIDLLFVAYRIPEPFSFIMTFFASNLIILISAVLFLNFVIKIFTFIKRSRNNKE